MARRQRLPARVDSTYTAALRHLSTRFNIAPYPGYTLYATRSVRGRCDYRRRDITVPTWCWQRGRGYVLYYLARGCAHSWAWEVDRFAGHGPVFMEHFKRLCPPEFQHFELDYKPKFAAAAGIRRPEEEARD